MLTLEGLNLKKIDILQINMVLKALDYLLCFKMLFLDIKW